MSAIRSPASWHFTLANDNLGVAFPATFIVVSCVFRIKVLSFILTITSSHYPSHSDFRRNVAMPTCRRQTSAMRFMIVVATVGRSTGLIDCPMGLRRRTSQRTALGRHDSATHSNYAVHMIVLNDHNVNVCDKKTVQGQPN